MDLIIAFVPYLSHDSLCALFELVKGLLEVLKNTYFHMLIYYFRDTNEVTLTSNV